MNNNILNNPNAERCFIGTALVDLRQFETWKAAITPDHFHDPRAKAIYEAQLQLNEQGQAPDLPAVYSYLDSKGQGTSENLAYLLQAGNAGAREISIHAKILLDCKARRDILTVTNKVMKDVSTGGDVFQAADKLKSLEISTLSADGVKSLSQLKLEKAALLESRGGKYKEVGGLPSGWEGFDMKTGGFGEGWLITVAGRPGMGINDF